MAVKCANIVVALGLLLGCGAVASLGRAGDAGEPSQVTAAPTSDTPGAGGNGGVSTSIPAPPNAPTATAATSITATGFSANWNASGGATGYRLDVATDSGFTNFVATYNNRDVGNVTTYAVSGLTGGTTYYYRLRAYNGSATSGNSNTITVTTVPAAPTATAATSITATGFSGNWNAATGATGYRLDVATNSGFTSFVTGYNDRNVSNVTTYAVSGLSASTTYYYRVRAYNGAGTSGNSGTITVTTVPAAPTATAATSITAAGFSANWNASTGATGYRLDVATNSGFTSFVTGYNDRNVNNVTTYAVSGLTAGTTYYYRVRAYNGTGTGGNSGTITVTTVPPAPTATAASSITAIGFSANWSAATGATGYRLDVAVDSFFTNFVAGYSNLNVGAPTTQSVSGLNPATVYYYRVRAYNGAGTSGDSNTVTVTTLPALPTVSTTPVTSATSTTAAGGGDIMSDGGATVTVRGVCWSTSANPTTGDAYTTDGGGTGTFGSSLTGLAAGTTYHVRAYATNTAGAGYGDDRTFATLAVHTVTFVAGAHGTLSGTPGQTVDHGSDCTAVTAVPDLGHHFTGWTGDHVGSDNPLTVTNVTADMTITANFAIDTHTVTFVAGAHGSLAGTTSQTVDYGADCTAVTATADDGYHFVNWTGTGGGASTDNPLTIASVTQDLTITANFTVVTCDVTFSAEQGGTVRGAAAQVVPYGGSTAPVTAVAADGWQFMRWTGTNAFETQQNPLTLTDVRRNTAIAATFAILPPEPVDTGETPSLSSEPNTPAGNNMPDLRLTIAVSPTGPAAGGTVATGDVVPFELAVENVGAGGATDVRVVVPIPDSMEYVSARVLVAESAQTASVQVEFDGQNVIVYVGDVPAGHTVATELMLRAKTSGVAAVAAQVHSTEQEAPVAAQPAAEIVVEDEYFLIQSTSRPGGCGLPGLFPLFTLVGLLGLRRYGGGGV
jgi:uncharacterized repeat protein (TIGR02543 family)